MENIKKLFSTQNDEDKYIGFQLLLQYSREEILSFFEEQGITKFYKVEHHIKFKHAFNNGRYPELKNVYYKKLDLFLCIYPDGIDLDIDPEIVNYWIETFDFKIIEV